MNNTYKRAVMRAAVLAGVTLSAGAVGLAAHADSASAAADVPVVSRLSIATGPQGGGTTTTIVGDDLAIAADEVPAEDPPADDPPADDPEEPAAVSFDKPTVKITIPATKTVAEKVITVPAGNVTVVSEDVLSIVTPASSVVGKGTVTVTNDDGTSTKTKAPVFTYTTAAPTVSGTSHAAAVTSEAGGTLTIDGTYLGDTKTTKVLVGGKAAKITANTGTKITATAPAGLKGFQDVVVTTPGGSVDGGTVEYTWTVPGVVWPEATPTTEKGATIQVTGTNLNLVTGGTLTVSGKAYKVSVKQPTATADKGKGLKLTVVVPAKVPAGSGALVLSTGYATTESHSLTVAAAGKPTLTTTVPSVAGAGGTVAFTGTNLHYITSVKAGSVTLSAGSGYTLDGATKVSIVVPKQAKVPAKLPIVITTDGGAVTYQLPVSDTVLTSAAYTDKKITLTGEKLASLTGVTVKKGDTAVTATFKAATDGKTSVATLAAAPADGTYTVAGKDASGLSFSTTFTVGSVTPPAEDPEVAAPTLADTAEYDAVAGTITVGGTDLDAVDADTWALTGSAIEVTVVVNPAGTEAVATPASTLPEGSYGITVDDADGVSLGEATFEVPAAD